MMPISFAAGERAGFKSQEELTLQTLRSPEFKNGLDQYVKLLIQAGQAYQEDADREITALQNITKAVDHALETGNESLVQLAANRTIVTAEKVVQDYNRAQQNMLGYAQMVQEEKNAARKQIGQVLEKAVALQATVNEEVSTLPAKDALATINKKMESLQTAITGAVSSGNGFGVISTQGQLKAAFGAWLDMLYCTPRMEKLIQDDYLQLHAGRITYGEMEEARKLSDTVRQFQYGNHSKSNMREDGLPADSVVRAAELLEGSFANLVASPYKSILAPLEKARAVGK